MVELRLDRVNTQYVTGNFTMTAYREPYIGFRLFETIRFKDKFGLQFPYFCIKDKNDLLMFDYKSRVEKDSDLIEYVDLFVSKFNNNVPLILKVCNRGQRTYYKWKDLEKNKNYDLRNLQIKFKPNSKLTEYLIPENDEVNKTITYIIDNKVSYHNITVTKSEYKETEFTFYTHKPKDGFKSRDSIVVYTNKIFNIKPNDRTSKKQITEDDQFDFKTFEYIKVYYKNNVTNPLLIEFITLDKKSHYYSIRNKRIWKRIIINDDNFIYEMSKIEYQLKPSIRFMLDQRTKYTNKETENVKVNNIKNESSIKTIETKGDTSETLKEENYSSYEHYFNEDYQPQNKITNSDRDPKNFLALVVSVFNIAIDTYDHSDEIEYLLYLPGESLHVFFYNKDNFPLLFRFNNKYYRPNSREEYFSKWIEVQHLNIDPNNSYKIRDELKKINQMLNEININKIMNYGINDEMVEEYFDKDPDHVCLNTECEIRCKNKKIAKKESEIPIRINVKSERFGIYNKYTHTTKNNYLIGCVTYNSTEILKGTKYICNSEGVSIEIYYFNFNNEKRTGYPLLIISKNSSELNYYYLNEKCEIEGSNNEIKLKEIEKHNFDLYRFLEHQNFYLNNVINININTKQNYQCCYGNYFNCTKQIVKVEKVEIGEYSNLEGKKYLTYKHTLLDKETNVEELSIKQENSNPSRRNRPFTVKNLKIYDKIIQLAHTKDDVKDPLFETSEAYVHFYGDDPRPLLVYTDGSAFRPKSLEEYDQHWILAKDIDYSKRGDGNYKLDSVIHKLHEISYDLNPVDIFQCNKYNINTPLHKNITIDVEKIVDLFYKMYLHTPLNGHKLGILKYKDLIPVDESYGTKSKEIESALIYYYNSDEHNKYPIFIQLNYSPLDSMCYILTSKEPLKWKRTDRIKLEKKRGRSRSKRDIQYTNEIPYDSEFMSTYQEITDEIGIKKDLIIQEDSKSFSPLPLALPLTADLTETTSVKSDSTPGISEESELSFDTTGFQGDQAISIENEKNPVIITNNEQSIMPSGIHAKQAHSRVALAEPSTESSPTTKDQNSLIPFESQIKTLPNSNDTDSYDTVLANGLGGFFGTIFSLSLISIFIYKFLLRIRIREMTPAF